MTAPAAQTPRPSLWTRLRRSFLVPSLALAGTAGLVLWLSRPHDGAKEMDRPHATRASAEAPALAGAKPESGPAADADAEPDDSSRQDARPQAPSPAAAPPPQTEDALRELEADAARQALETDAPGGAGAVDAKLGKLGEAPEPTLESPPKDPEADAARWDLIERGDRARQDGDCAAARTDYGIATEDDDAAVRARAYAGLGLCNAQAGDDAGAEDAFERARGIDAGVGKYIDAERKSSGNYSPAKPKASKSKRKPAAPSASKVPSQQSADQATNPFNP